MKNMKFLPLIAALALAGTVNSHAQTSSWLTAVGGDWSESTNWSAGVPSAQGAVAVFSNNWTGQTITNSGTSTIGQLQAFDTSTNTGLNIISGTLVLDNGASKPIINTGLGTAFGENSGNRLRIGSVLDGTNGFERQGGGYVDISGISNTFSGTIVLTAPASGGGSFLVINSDSNLGATTNAITATLAAQPIGLYNDASAGSFTLNSNRTITTSGTGDFWVKNKLGANMTIDGVISGTARLRKNDSGTLTLTAANTYSGGTLLDGGTLVLSGGSNRLLSGSTVTFNSASTLDIGNTTQTLGGLSLLGAGQMNTIRGTGGSLIFNAPGDQTWNTTATGTTVNMSNLSNFTFNRTAGAFQVNANAVNVTNTVFMARENNTINANFVRWGGGGNFAGQNVLVRLGQTNSFNIGSELLLGYFQGNGDIAFQAGLTDPSVAIRGAGGGTNAAPLVRVGQANSGAQSTIGILNLTGGRIDAIATQFDVGVHMANAGGTAGTGILTMPAGTIVAETMSVGRKTATTGSPNVTGTVNQSGGSVTATTLYLGNSEAAAGNNPNLVANYNLTGGTIYATTIGGNGTNYGASTVRNLNISGGEVQNKSGGDLTINGVNATSQGRLNVVLGASGATFEAESGRAINIGANTLMSGTGGLTKTGEGILSLSGVHTYNGPTLISDGTLKLELSSSIASAVTVGAGGAIGGAGTIASTLAFDSGAKFVFSLTETLLVDGATVTFNGFGISDLLGLNSSVDVGSYTIIGGLADIDTSGLLNLGATNSYDLGDGKSAYFTEGSLIVNVVPEPSTYALIALAAAGFGAHVLRRRRSRR